jgi:enoyl-CoA hydratase
VVADDAVPLEALRVAQHIASLSPQAMRLNKQVLRQFAAGGHSSRAQREPHYAYAASAEHFEGLAAFNEKRPAVFPFPPLTDKTPPP